MSNLTKITDDLWALKANQSSSVGFFTNNPLNFHDTFIGNTYDVLGTVSETEIDFDVHPYCENDPHNIRKYKLYPNGATNFNTTSFRSLLKSKGITPTPETKIVILKKI